MKLLKSEWLKLIYVRSHWGLLVAATFVSVLSVVVTPFIIENDMGLLGLSLDQTAAIDATYANAISGYIFSLILGIMLITGEFRHGTAVATFLVAPKRVSVIGAKLTIAAIGGIAIMLVSTALAMVCGYIVLQFFDYATAASEYLFFNTFLVATISGIVLAVIGLALGTLVRNQVFAIVGALVYLFVIDPLLLTLLPNAGKYFPSGLITAMLSIDVNAPELGIDTSVLLSPLLATLILLGYGFIFATVAIATSLRRDVD